MEIKKTETANITEEHFYNAAQGLYDDYGLDFDKNLVLTAVIDNALEFPDDVTPWIECLTPEQTRDILKHMRDVFTAYINEITNAQWDAIMEEE
jgi:hypothetical protein